VGVLSQAARVAVAWRRADSLAIQRDGVFLAQWLQQILAQLELSFSRVRSVTPCS